MHNLIDVQDHVTPVSVSNTDKLEEQIKKYKELAENGQSAIETNKLLTEKFNKLLKLTKQFIREEDDPDGCMYCKHYIECREQKCPCYEEGIGMEDDKGNKYFDTKWTCMDFNYGECRRYEEEGNTFCKDCKNMSNWEWNEE